MTLKYVRSICFSSFMVNIAYSILFRFFVLLIIPAYVWFCYKGLHRRLFLMISHTNIRLLSSGITNIYYLFKDILIGVIRPVLVKRWSHHRHKVLPVPQWASAVWLNKSVMKFSLPFLFRRFHFFILIHFVLSCVKTAHFSFL